MYKTILEKSQNKQDETFKWCLKFGKSMMIKSFTFFDLKN